MIIITDDIKQPDSHPITYFKLDSSEQFKYNAFRVQYQRREQASRNGLTPDLDTDLQSRFLELVDPFIQGSGLRVANCFVSYSRGLVSMETPVYNLFENSEPFDLNYNVALWFDTSQENLTCTASLRREKKYLDARGNLDDVLIKDLLFRVASERSDFPNLGYTGLLHFAPADQAVPLMMHIRNIVFKLGPETFREICILSDEYAKAERYSEPDSEADKIRTKVFKEAYEHKLALELARSGLIGRTLRLV